MSSWNGRIGPRSRIGGGLVLRRGGCGIGQRCGIGGSGGVLRRGGCGIGQRCRCGIGQRCGNGGGLEIEFYMM